MDDEIRKTIRFEQNRIAFNNEGIYQYQRWIRKYEQLIEVQKEHIVKYKGLIKDAEMSSEKCKARIKELKAKE